MGLTGRMKRHITYPSIAIPTHPPPTVTGTPPATALINTHAAATRLDVSVRHFRRLIAQPKNRIRKVYVGERALRFEPDDIENFIRRNTK